MVKFYLNIKIQSNFKIFIYNHFIIFFLGIDINKYNERFQTLLKRHNLEVERLKGKRI